jgi:formylglycine-generating enzyme required for sulfatase activity
MVNGELKQLRDLVSSAICRLYHGDGKTFCWQGTAYAIGTHAFLTAYHVVEGVKPEQVYLGSPLFDPRQRIQDIKPHPNRDVALLLLDPAVSAPINPLEPSDETLAQGKHVVSSGFTAESQSLNLIPTTITAYEGAATQFVAKPHIANGMSGGPVLLNGKLAGLLVARDTDKGDHFIISLASFRGFLDEQNAFTMLARLTSEQEAMLNLLRSEPTDPSIPTSLIDAVRAQPAADLTAYRLKRIAYWRQQDFQLDKRFVKLLLLLDHGMEHEAGRFLEPQEKKSRFDDLADLLAARPEDVALVLLGRPGCGKTTLLAHLEHELALAAIRHPRVEQTFVFWMPLNDYPMAGEWGDNPLDWLSKAWGRRHPRLPPLERLLHDHPSLLLLDALNEIPHRDTTDYSDKLAAWRDFLARLRDDYPKTRAVFTCRSLDYGAGLSDFQRIRVPQVQFEELSDEAIIAFLKKRLPDDWEALWRKLKETSQLTLERTPFYLDLEVRQFHARGRTALGPSELISGIVWQSLQRELAKPEQRRHQTFNHPDLITQTDLQRIHSQAWLKAPHRLADQGDLIGGLTALAYAMQTHKGGGKQIRLDWVEADPYIASDPHKATRVREAAWHLDLLQNDIELCQCAFHHQLLQEYFAGQHLARDQQLTPLEKPWQKGDLVEVENLAIADPLPGVPSTGWEETCLHAAAITDDPEGFVEAVATRDLVLAARCATSPEVKLSDACKDRLRQDLLARSRDPRADLRARIDAGLALGELGDPRLQRQPGLEAEYIPPKLAPIPSGDYRLGSETGDPDERPVYTLRLESFEIGQYPVSNAEWHCFMEAGGYEDARWWETNRGRQWREKGLENTEWMDFYRSLYWDLKEDFAATMARHPNWTELYRQQLQEIFIAMSETELEEWLGHKFGAQTHREPGEWRNPRFANPAQPVVGVCWYEARAYCRWLSHQSGRRFQLPGEAQWEAAARGTGARDYPWEGAGFEAGRANTYEAHLRRTTPLGVFPAGATPGERPIYDLAGNVWEWTASLHRDYPLKQDGSRDEPEDSGHRLVRGGAWVSQASSARSAYRYLDHPGDRLNDLGFRVLCCPPSSDTGH